MTALFERVLTSQRTFFQRYQDRYFDGLPNLEGSASTHSYNQKPVNSDLRLSTYTDQTYNVFMSNAMFVVEDIPLVCVL